MYVKATIISVSMLLGQRVALVIDRLSTLEEKTGHYIYCAARLSSHRRPGTIS